MNGDYRRVDEDALRSHTAAVLRGAGMTADGAAIAAGVLVASDARGIESHGVARLPQYVRLIDSGALDPAAGPSIERESATTGTTAWAMSPATTPCAWPSPRRATTTSAW